MVHGNFEKHEKILIVSVITSVLVGFFAGAFTVNTITPNTDEMLKLCRMDPESLKEDKALRAVNAE